MAYEKFLNLNPEKQAAILNAAMNEFARRGYEDASTIEIAKNAGISKGLLFHYFNTKKELFVYLYDYTVQLVITDFFDLINLKEKDILKRCRQMNLVKIELLQKSPQVFDFLKMAVYTGPEEVRQETESRGKALRTVSLARLFDDIDVTRFKDGTDVEQAKNIIIWTMEGIGNKQQNEVRDLGLDEIDYEQALAEYDAILETLRQAFYK